LRFEMEKKTIDVGLAAATGSRLVGITGQFLPVLLLGSEWSAAGRR
jgi:hypothetical protein